MQRRNFNALKTPIIGRVLQLNGLLLEKSGKLNKRLQHTYADDILRKGNLLFNYAMRQLKNEYKPIIVSMNTIDNIDNFIKLKVMAAIVQGSRAELPKVENKEGKWYFRSCYEQVEQTTDEVRCVEVVLLVRNTYAAAQQTNEFNAERGSDIRITPEYFDDPYVSVQNETPVE